jgi:hypothetical protein
MISSLKCGDKEGGEDKLRTHKMIYLTCKNDTFNLSNYLIIYDHISNKITYQLVVNAYKFVTTYEAVFGVLSNSNKTSLGILFFGFYCTTWGFTTLILSLYFIRAFFCHKDSQMRANILAFKSSFDFIGSVVELYVFYLTVDCRNNQNNIADFCDDDDPDCSKYEEIYGHPKYCSIASEWTMLVVMIILFSIPGMLGFIYNLIKGEPEECAGCRLPFCFCKTACCFPCICFNPDSWEVLGKDFREIIEPIKKKDEAGEMDIVKLREELEKDVNRTVNLTEMMDRT